MKPRINHKVSILLIDDDEDDFLFLHQALAALSTNFNLSCIQDVDHLFEVIDIHKPFFIFIDFYLPKRSGLDCLRQIKRHPNYKHIPVVIWSTSRILNQVETACKEGAHAFIEKPNSYKQLVYELSAIFLQNCIGL